MSRQMKPSPEPGQGTDSPAVPTTPASLTVWRDPRGNHLECSRCAEEFAFADSLILHWQLFHGSPYGRLYLGMGRNRDPKPRESLAEIWLRRKPKQQAYRARKRAEEAEWLRAVRAEATP